LILRTIFQIVSLFTILWQNKIIPTISLENEIVAQGLMNTTYHQGYPGYPRSWLSPYAIVRYTSIASSGIIRKTMVATLKFNNN
jgi:uncharacterized membrane protein (DUF106 family)